jgi:hypothetical protein
VNSVVAMTTGDALVGQQKGSSTDPPSGITTLMLLPKVIHFIIQGMAVNYMCGCPWMHLDTMQHSVA